MSDLGDRLRRRQAREDAVGGRRDLLRRAGPAGAGLEERRRRRLVAVVHGQREARPEEAGGEMPAEVAEPDEAEPRPLAAGAHVGHLRERDDAATLAAAGTRRRIRSRTGMRAIVFTAAGGNEVIRIEERPDPVPSGDDVLVAVRYAALNPADLAQREGRYPAPPGSPPDVPGLEVAGTVIACGPTARRFAPGDRVFGLVGGGGLAEQGARPRAARDARCRRASASSRPPPCRRCSSRRTTRS